MPDTRFPTGKPIALEPGDITVLSTDGLLEANSAEGGLFGYDRVIRVVACNREKTAAEIITAIYEAVTEFSGSKKHRDDITIVVIKAEAEIAGRLPGESRPQ